MARLTVKVIPRSSRNRVVGWLGDTLKVTVTAPPEGGKANAAVVALLAESLDVDASSVQCVAGHASTRKIVAIAGLNESQVRERLRALTTAPETSFRNDPPPGALS